MKILGGLELKNEGRLLNRRNALKIATAGAATAVAAPAIAQSQPAVKWRLASSFPKNLVGLTAAADTFINRIGEATDNQFQIQYFAPGEITPALQTLDATQNGTIECTHTGAYYYIGKDPAFAFATNVPFGLNARQQDAWLFEGGGNDVLKPLFDQFNVVHFPCGSTGAQMGGFFRKELKTVADMKGLKMRIGGSAGVVLQKLGLVPQQIAGGDIYPALEKGTIDAAEWVGPYDDEKLGLYKVAKYYYYPGWWEGGPELDLFVNIKSWQELPKDYQAILESACAEANIDCMAKYDALNPAALRRLVAAGVILRPFPREIMQACYKASVEVYDGFAETNPKFKKVYEPWKKFRDEEILWFRVTEREFDQFMVTAATQNAAPAKK
jgi:TRAP-type mannitol/chloroaromatic compound transport system substrate-binding protein